ncbi:probable endonuclease 4 isoform X2 [Dermacentor silvarum]|uniref:probable endonuclease 4 isoform X2 n=1 Tax=Dermacentor silvarum TaxID=543639 RepID=UPI00210182F8|nr:probable endonuclease 4 isoform X2 [Dermacentor silvarum]
MSPRKTRSSSKQASAASTPKATSRKKLTKKSSAQNGHKKSPQDSTKTKAMPAKEKSSKKAVVTSTRKQQEFVGKSSKPLKEDVTVNQETPDSTNKPPSNGFDSDVTVKVEPQEAKSVDKASITRASPSRKLPTLAKTVPCQPITVKRSSSPVAADGAADLPKKKKMDGAKSPAKLSKKGTAKNSKFVGAHMSVSGGLELAVSRAAAMGAKSFGLFLRSQRQWAAKPLSQETANLFRDACREHNFAPHQILPHGSYLLNCGSPDPVVLEKSRATLVDELKRCEMLGLVYYNFHPESINQAHKETTYVISVIENMCKQGNTLGGDFHELRGIIDRVKDKSRIGVCLDTCHAFAAGYDLATQEGFEKMMNDFESIIGLSYLKALHLNDSKGKVGSHLDRHENIGHGNIGLDGFRRIMNDPRLDHLPMILETPETDYGVEIALLNGLCSS